MTLAEIKTWFDSEEGKAHPRRADIELELNLIKVNENNKHKHVFNEGHLFQYLLATGKTNPELVTNIYFLVKAWGREAWRYADTHSPGITYRSWTGNKIDR